MRDLVHYGNVCIDELKSIGIECGNVTKWTVNTRAYSRWGMCHHRNGSHQIEISSRLLNEEVDERSLKNTIIHELLHTLPKCNNHKKIWQEKARFVNQKLGYNIKRTSSAKEQGVLDTGYKYKVFCYKCHKIKCYRINCQSINSKHLRCSYCGGMATKYDVRNK